MNVLTSDIKELYISKTSHREYITDRVEIILPFSI